ncbi:hypothetical protein QLH32_05520 [Acinetobacter corruptisaponis]|uniref:Uncharacterized protein n=1 Tax=Acinetobacter corruptisaponis TaxID=3045147 RepID=A0ABY8S638_9GAMM|nr:hypothetical protein [Acinetobacter sp. KCTC 92772]WHP06926.1 hypothetical protein QLH32_05520 [Acinetobacter sp. KCTC 92772]
MNEIKREDMPLSVGFIVKMNHKKQPCTFKYSVVSDGNIVGFTNSPYLFQDADIFGIRNVDWVQPIASPSRH